MPYDNVALDIKWIPSTSPQQNVKQIKDIQQLSEELWLINFLVFLEMSLMQNDSMNTEKNV